MKKSNYSPHLDSRMDCVTVPDTGAAGSGPTEKKAKFVHFSLFHYPFYLYLIESMNYPHLYLCVEIYLLIFLLYDHTIDLVCLGEEEKEKNPEEKR